MGSVKKTHWPSTDVDGPSGGHLERNRGLDGSSGGPVSSGFSQNALAVHGSGWTFWRLSSKKPRPLRLFRGTCFRWVQPKRTGCSQLWMDLLAAIFARNRSLIGTHRGDLFSHFQTKSAPINSWVERHTAGWARHPLGPVFTLSVKKAYHCSWLAVFHAFPCKKVSHVGKND